MWELDYKESRVPKNWAVVLEKTLESPLDSKEIEPVHPKGNQNIHWKDWCWSWKLQYFGHLMQRTASFYLFTYLFIYLFILNWFLLKDPDAGKDWRREKGTTEDEMVGWHHRLYGHEFEQAPGVGDGQGILACCSLWGRKKSDTTEWLNWTL